MIYDHIVKSNGKYYAAGEEVPDFAESLLNEDSMEVSDSDTVSETDAEINEKPQNRRGRPKKTE